MAWTLDTRLNKSGKIKHSCFVLDFSRKFFSFLTKVYTHTHIYITIHTHTHIYCCSVAQLCLTLCDPMDCSMPGFTVLHYFPEFAQTHVHWISDAIQPSHPLSSPSPPAFNLSQHQGLFQWVSSSHQVAKVLELQHQCHSFQQYSGLISFRKSLWMVTAPMKLELKYR